MTYITKSPQVLTKVRFLDVYMAGHRGYIAGGCFKNIFQNNRIKDIDVFFENETDFSEAVIHFKGSPDYVFSYENKNTVAYKNIITNIRVELIRRFFAPAAEMLDSFDFSITKFAYVKTRVEDSVTFDCLFHPDFFEHLVCKKLVLGTNILFPVSTFERSLRYSRYGFGLCKESKQNLVENLKRTNIDDFSDALYFGID